MTFASRTCGEVGSECQIHSTSYSSISRMAWPLGSRIITAFLKPSLACASCGMSTTSGADELRAGPAQALGGRPDVLGDQRRLPMPEIAGPGVAGHRPAAGWRLVFEELDVGRGRSRHHRRDQACVVEQAVQHFLGRSGVEGDSADLEPEQIAVERHAPFRTVHGHRGVVNADETACWSASAMTALPLPRGK